MKNVVIKGCICSGHIRNVHSFPRRACFTINLTTIFVNRNLTNSVLKSGLTKKHFIFSKYKFKIQQ